MAFVGVDMLRFKRGHVRSTLISGCMFSHHHKRRWCILIIEKIGKSVSVSVVDGQLQVQTINAKPSREEDDRGSSGIRVSSHDFILGMATYKVR